MTALRAALRSGLVIPAHPLALTAARRLDERHQRALTRYYLDAGAGGIALGVHTTQFALHQPKRGLLKPVLQLGVETARAWSRAGAQAIMIAGVIGRTRQAVQEASLARDLGYDAVLLSYRGWGTATRHEMINHARSVAAIMPVIGFYLQPAVGGRRLNFGFWRDFAAIDNIVAIKVAPFDRYATLDVVRAITDAGRGNDIALYTGNDDHILLDLLTRNYAGSRASLRIVGGLLGHWACWTGTAVQQHRVCARIARSGAAVPSRLLTLATEVTDANGAIFDVANHFRGCIPGIHEILHRQRLLAGRWCLNPREVLSNGQMQEIDRVCRLYPHLADNAFVREGIDAWMR